MQEPKVLTNHKLNSKGQHIISLDLHSDASISAALDAVVPRSNRTQRNTEQKRSAAAGDHTASVCSQLNIINII